jgi:excisionase family DNA binding protein
MKERQSENSTAGVEAQTQTGGGTYYSPEEIAARLAVEAETVRAWLRRGLLAGEQIEGDWRIPKRELLKLLIP